MIHDNPYDQAEDVARDEGRRQALQDDREEREVERWKLARFEAPEMQPRSIITDDDQDKEMTIGLDCCLHYVPYGSDCDQCDEEDQDAAYEPGDPKRSDFLNGEE